MLYILNQQDKFFNYLNLLVNKANAKLTTVFIVCKHQIIFNVPLEPYYKHLVIMQFRVSIP